MGCTSSSGATADGSEVPRAKYAAETPGTPKASPSCPSRPLPTSGVVQESDGTEVTARPMGLLQDADGDEAHEFWEEDPRSLSQGPAKENPQLSRRQLGPRKLRRLPFQGAAAKALQRVDAKAAAKGNHTRESSAEDGSNASNLCQGSFAGALKEISVTFSEELLKTEQAPDHFQSKA
ncbi:unnamed protein product [Effrenium voratum]|uniref:Uncharacterized protein n=1 Tax=Effrenium voratum TaxID=2562239 RepID=A0AA36IVT6_9DINO|nr:unnamed protein product [Effrenium voratum]